MAKILSRTSGSFRSGHLVSGIESRGSRSATFTTQPPIKIEAHKMKYALFINWGHKGFEKTVKFIAKA